MASASPVQLSYITLDVFTSTKYVGNPLAVVLVPATDSASLTQQTKQRIAREFNLSETVFLHSPPDDHSSSTSRAIDIFTTEEELPFAGHPTIGTAYLVLHHLGWTQVDTLVTKAGPIRIAPSGTTVRAAIPHAVHVHTRTLGDSAVATAVPAAALSPDPTTRQAELAAPAVSIVRGMTFVLVRLPGLAQLAEVSTARPLDFSRVKDALLDKGEWGGGFVARYYYTEPDAGEDRVRSTTQLRTRMVELGFEDPATGSAACTLASYLALERPVPGAGGGGEGEVVKFKIQQGVEMGRKSDIEVEVHVVGEGAARKITELYLGGTAVVVMKGTIEV